LDVGLPIFCAARFRSRETCPTIRLECGVANSHARDANRPPRRRGSSPSTLGVFQNSGVECPNLESGVAFFDLRRGSSLETQTALGIFAPLASFGNIGVCQLPAFTPSDLSLSHCRMSS